jgi:ABC-type sulfate transport system permease component
MHDIIRKENKMNKTWKWAIGIASAILLILIPLFVGMMFLPNGGYGMMGYGYAWHMPMMFGGFGMMLFMWLISIASLVIIGLGIAWLVKALIAPK